MMGKMKTKGYRGGGKVSTKMKTKGFRGGGKVSTKGGSMGGASTMTLSKLRAMAKDKGYKIIKT